MLYAVDCTAPKIRSELDAPLSPGMASVYHLNIINQIESINI